jgi:hypothetical protein
MRRAIRAESTTWTMAGDLLIVSAMKYLKFVLLFFLPFSALLAAGQEAAAPVNPQGVVESIQISGVPEDDISQAVRGMMQRLVGQKLDQQVANDLLDRIQIELPGFIATTKLDMGTDPDRVKLVFVVERSNEEPGRRSNVNSRYTVEDVQVEGIDESRLSKAIRDDIHKLIGQMLNQALADRIHHRMIRELRPRYFVVKKVVKGSRPQHVVVVYEVKKAFWIPFLDLSPYIVYHSKQNFSAAADVPIKVGSNRFSFGIVDDSDQLLERFAGFRVGYENVNVGTERLGIGLHYGSYHERWQPATTSEIYRERRTFDPSLTFAFDPRLKLTAGVSLSELEIQYPLIHSENSNAAAASLNFRGVWESSESDKHEVDAGYDLRAGAHNLDSDFIFTRHLGHALYAFQHERNKLTISLMAGGISGRAPLFERFSLGNTTTLRGWNKFDIAPLGGNRLIHATLQYGFGDVRIGTWTNDIDQKRPIETGFYLFYDTGAVGDRGGPMKARHSVGLGFGEESFFVALGFPIRSERLQPTFMMGARF